MIIEVVRKAEASGIPMESVNAEYDEGHFELTLEYGDALRAGDDAFLFRALARETVQTAVDRNGQTLDLDLTFMGKPFASSGNGVHVNFSMRDSEGRSAFVDACDLDGISALARTVWPDWSTITGA